MIRYITYGLMVFMVFFFACKKMPLKPDYDNPLDPENRYYIKPNVSITFAPSYGKIIDTNAVYFEWEGHTKGYFSYRLSNSPSWSEWSKSKSVLYSCLTDGDYTFYVKERYENGDEQENEASSYFIIDHIYGPGIVLEDQCIETTVNSVFDVFVSLEDVENIRGVSVNIWFDKSMLELVDQEDLPSMISTVEGNRVFISTPLSEANANGLTEINVVRFEGDAGSSDLKQIIRLQFKALSAGDAQIIINDNSALRDFDNNAIQINKLVNANIEIR